MSRFKTPFLVVAAASATLLSTAATCEASPERGRHARAPDLDSARAEVAVGRYWHAARHLRELRAAGTPFGPEETLLLARAEAGYRSWDGVIAALAGAEWLADEEGGLGLRLLGRAMEGQEDWSAAAEAYGRYLAVPHGREADDRAAVAARRVRALSRAGAAEAALSALDSLASASGPVASWLALELAEAGAADGDTVLVRRLVAVIDDPDAASRAWELEARSVRAAGDRERAVRVYRALADEVAPEGRRARVAASLGELLLAGGDTAAAVDHFRAALDLAAATGSGVTAARRLVELDALDGGRALAAARALDRAGADRAALEAYDFLVASDDGPGEEALLARARLMAVTEGRQDEAVAAFRALSTSEDEAVGAGALESWADLRRRQGRSGDVATLRERLVERYPGSAEAANHVFLRGDAAHDRQELDAALGDYGRLQEMAPSLDRAGLARMRAAQIHLHRGDSARALGEFRAYLEAFPDGRRGEEAAYWSGRILLGTGSTEEGEALLRSILEREPLSYYAVLAADVLDVPYRLPGEPGGGTPPMPEWMGPELATVDLLTAAGLEPGRAARTDRLVERALDTSLEDALRLARELIGRDQTLAGINLGWELRRRGMPWSRALLEVTYPLPHREMVYQAARARGLDPIFVAAVIRQESAFDPDIRSHAGAVGLMQIMPETGRQLAAAVGPGDFDPGSLVTPEINLHLGTQYLLDLWRRFDGDLPLVLSAYNAGPHRASTWRGFPEAVDPLRFTERIPYGETRDYVKLIRRNMALYRALYGDEPVS